MAEPGVASRSGGGQSRVSEDGYIEGPPELIVDIAATSSSIDLHDKLRAYRRNGVREYVICRTQERRIDWFELAGGEYRLLPSGDDGAIESRLFPGLCIAVPALLAGKLAAALDAINRSIDSPEHRGSPPGWPRGRSGRDISYAQGLVSLYDPPAGPPARKARVDE